MTHHALDDLAALRPSSARIDAEWTGADRARTLDQILTAAPERAPRPRWLPRNRRRWIPVGVAAAAVSVIVVGLFLPAGSPGGPDTAVAAAFQHLERAAGVHGDARVKPGQFAVQSSRTVTLRNGHLLPSQAATTTSWISSDGFRWERHREAGTTNCSGTPVEGRANLNNPNQRFYDVLPTEPDDLNAYMRSHVSGSSSKDEAVFVAVGDGLRYADGLATSALRAAFIGVLGRTDHVTIHPGVRDYLGRQATRVDFVGNSQRVGEVSSLFFDPTDARLLEERHTGRGEEGAVFTNISIVTSQRVVDELPATMHGCPIYTDH